jgi:hypothetical protein
MATATTSNAAAKKAQRDAQKAQEKQYLTDAARWHREQRAAVRARMKAQGS